MPETAAKANLLLPVHHHIDAVGNRVLHILIRHTGKRNDPRTKDYQQNTAKFFLPTYCFPHTRVFRTVFSSFYSYVPPPFRRFRTAANLNEMQMYTLFESKNLFDKIV